MIRPSPARDRTPTDLPWTEAVRRDSLSTLQINLGLYCNMACSHCHVQAGPKRTEMMSETVRLRIAEWIRQHRPATVDLTGGAPELIPGFRDLVVAARAAGASVMDRCNLSCLFEPGQADLADFLAEHRVLVVASLPCYLADNVDRQRGRGAFDASIRGLQRLNAVGYGIDEQLPLHLVYNPTGPSLPPPQHALQGAYRQRLHDDWGIAFSSLWCLTNMPITRYRAFLARIGRLEAYEDLLAAAYNPETLDGLMCRSTLSVDWRGRVYDCDFNQALDLPLADAEPRFLWDLDPQELSDRPVAMRRHCLACTAGCGSSCTGATA